MNFNSALQTNTFLKQKWLKSDFCWFAMKETSNGKTPKMGSGVELSDEDHQSNIYKDNTLGISEREFP